MCRSMLRGVEQMRAAGGLRAFLAVRLPVNTSRSVKADRQPRAVGVAGACGPPQDKTCRLSMGEVRDGEVGVEGICCGAIGGVVGTLVLNVFQMGSLKGTEIVEDKAAMGIVTRTSSRDC